MAKERPPRDLVSVVLPVFHNRPQLPELHRRLTEVLDRLAPAHELVFVDDDGRDGSLEWLLECAQRDPRTRLVALPHNRGQHQAVIAGLRAATGDVVAVMDADLQDPPEALPALVDGLGSSCEVVFARRASRHQTTGRHLTGRVFKRMLRRLAGSRIPSGTGMFFVASRRAVDAALASAEEARYVPLLFDHAGASMSAIEVVKEVRLDSPSAYTGAARLRLAWGAVRQALVWRLAGRRLRAARSSRVGADDVRQRQALAGQQDDANHE